MDKNQTQLQFKKKNETINYRKQQSIYNNSIGNFIKLVRHARIKR